MYQKSKGKCIKGKCITAGWTTRVEPYFWFLHFLISSWYQVVFKLQSLTQYLDYPLFLTYRLGFGKYYTRIFFWQNISFQKKLISNVISIWGEFCNEISWIENAPKYPNIHPIWCAETSVNFAVSFCHIFLSKLINNYQTDILWKAFQNHSLHILMQLWRRASYYQIHWPILTGQMISFCKQSNIDLVWIPNTYNIIT